ncbi:MAG TPA: hypothetical protein VHR16_04110 [Candidatus Limnocylindrales bacterium]|jgi:hypothetical protein|nr:hypothetical protein [Candidatus Limnocylindrales bacterium]
MLRFQALAALQRRGSGLRRSGRTFAVVGAAVANWGVTALDSWSLARVTIP